MVRMTGFVLDKLIIPRAEEMTLLIENSALPESEIPFCPTISGSVPRFINVTVWAVVVLLSTVPNGTARSLVGGTESDSF